MCSLLIILLNDNNFNMLGSWLVFEILNAKDIENQLVKNNFNFSALIVLFLKVQKIDFIKYFG